MVEVWGKGRLVGVVLGLGVVCLGRFGVGGGMVGDVWVLGGMVGKAWGRGRYGWGG